MDNFYKLQGEDVPGTTKFFLKFFLSISINTYTNIKKKFKTITILYNKLQYIVLQSFYKGIVKCESNVEYNLTS